MDVPERIYMKINHPISSEYTEIIAFEEGDGIEYCRTDAFIEKADEFIGSFFHPDDTELRNCLLKKFHEYMKGE
jgi:hypothetical protein